jgi:hypothetical protein
MSEEEVTFNLEINVEPALNSIRQVEGLTFRTLGYMQRLGLPENFNQAIGVVQDFTMVVRLAHSAIIALQLASGPIGWWRAGLAIVGAGFAAASTVASLDAMYDNERSTS